jgi:hypothetical protein
LISAKDFGKTQLLFWVWHMPFAYVSEKSVFKGGSLITCILPDQVAFVCVLISKKPQYTAGLWGCFYMGAVLSGVLITSNQFALGHAYGRTLLLISALLCVSGACLTHNWTSVRLMSMGPAGTLARNFRYSRLN